MQRILVYVVVPPRLLLLDVAGPLEVLRRANQVQAAVRPPRILEIAKVIGDGQGAGRAVASRGRCRHDSPP